MNIEYFGEPGRTVYAILRTTTGYTINPSTLALDTPGSLDHWTYAIALPEDSVATGRYFGTIATGATATLVCEYWEQIGSGPDRTVDTSLGATTFYFDGNQEWPTESLSAIDGSSSGGGTTTSGDLSNLERMVRQLLNLKTRTSRLG